MPGRRTRRLRLRAPAGGTEADGAVMRAFARLPPDVQCHHLVGNHELACFTPSQLVDKGFGRDGQLWYSFAPADGWRLVVINSMHESVVRPGSNKLQAAPEGDAEYAAARAVLVAQNVNLAGGEATWYSGVNWAKGLSAEQAHFLPYNGAAGEKQRRWLAEQLADAKRCGQRVIVASHVPVLGEAAYPTDVMLDRAEVLEVVESSGVVAAFLAGHCHPGGYCVRNGIAHVTFRAPLEVDPDVHSECAATVRVFPGSIEIEGHGAQPSYSIPVR
eukprot:TRINITY_DN8636_c0_g2_i1.p1 TRINITY_DN8636_c0_g2~~TRINITY_DN8636_c0_g2_i1.p1  ORF type:complete len:273 (+),score=95.79 TRINITY_DN8636_c0_g2_i1:286-1104(+)